MRRLLLLPLLLCVTGCELTLDIEVPRADQVLVVNAPFEVGQPWRVGLSHSQSVQDYDYGPRGVTGATVEIYSEDKLIEELSACPIVQDECVSIGFPQRVTYSGTTTPQAGVTYTLRIRHPDFDEVTATDTAPLPIARDQLSASANRRPGQHERFVGTRLEIADGPNAAYYALRITQQLGDNASPEQIVETPFSSSSPVFVRANSDPFDQGGDRYYHTGYFTDDAFENALYTLLIDASDYQYCDGPPGDCVFYDTYTHVYAVSRAYFDYVKSAIAYGALGGDDNPLGEPVRITGNIDGGLGFFAGRARTTIRVEED